MPADAVAAGAVMGVLNVTPDSFSDGGRFLDHGAALEHGRRLVEEGAAIDTRHAEVARAAVSAGATIVNDVSASLGEVAAELGVGWVAMHMRGDPRTMQDEPVYGDVVAEVRDFLVERAERAAEAGVGEVWIDPGIGFGKTSRHNLELLAALPALVETGWPVIVGVSRKRFLGVLAAASDGTDGQTPPGDRREGSIAAATWAYASGVQVVRAHDVLATVQAAQVVG